MKQYASKSAIQTRQIASDLARKIKSSVIALEGELGVGKTTFIQGFAQGLGIKDKIISPTFVLIRQHPIPVSDKTLFHIDLYRLEKGLDINNLGLKDIWLNPKNVVLIEWAEKIENYLPQNTIRIILKKEEGDIRYITIY